MAPTKGHFLYTADFPIYSVAFTGDRELLVAGGGGQGRSGVKNSLVSVSTLYSLLFFRVSCGLYELVAG